jgi:hypothetical protein
LSTLRANKKDLKLSHNKLILKGNPGRQTVEEQERCQAGVNNGFLPYLKVTKIVTFRSMYN